MIYSVSWLDKENVDLLPVEVQLKGYNDGSAFSLPSNLQSAHIYSIEFNQLEVIVIHQHHFWFSH